MMIRLSALSATLMLAACPAPIPADPAPAPPKIIAFTASRSSVQAGEEVTLSFTTTGAKAVSLTDPSGGEVPVNGSVASGSATVKPSKSSLYVLRAEGDGGRDARFVQIAVGEQLADVFVVAVPAEVEAGDEVQLVYSALNASKIALVAGDGTRSTLPGPSGVTHVVPAKTSTYRLEAFAGDAGAVTAEAHVKVRPVLTQFELTPTAARSGEKITLSWKTGGADELVINEANFGELLRTTEALRVNEGTLDFTVPAELSADAGMGTSDAGTPDGGAPLQLPEGFPLKFTLTVKSTDPAVTLSRLAEGFVGSGPRIDALSSPSAATVGKQVTISWNTTNAIGVKLLIDGLLVYEPLPSNTVAIASGSFRLTMPAKDAVVELVATSFRGLTVKAARQVLSVKPPKLLTATLPAAVGAAGASATAAWTTQDASELQIYLKQGPTAFVTNTPARVAAGMASVYPGRTTTYVFAARNLAGDVDQLERTINVTSPAQVNATPSPTTPGTDVTFAWDLGSVAGFSAIYGVPLTTATPINASTRFIDLAASVGVKPLAFSNADDATAVIPSAEGFRFPILGRVFDNFTVSTNGFVGFGSTSPLPANVSLALDPAVPPMAAVFWDDLVLGAGNVSYLVAGAAFPRVLVVQWTDVRLKSDPLSHLTFQAQLSETGAVYFLYKTLQDTVSQGLGQSATIGIQVARDEFFAQHSFDSASVGEGLELEWLTSNAATGTAVAKAARTALYSLTFAKGSDYVQGLVPLNVFGPGAVGVREAMPQPDLSFPGGKWVELFNPQSLPLDLGGLKLRSLGSATGFEFPAGATLPGNGYLVVGDSTDPLLNGDAGVTLQLTDVPLASADTLRLTLGSTDVSVLTWADSVVGTSVQSAEAAIDTNGVALGCTRTKTFNPNGNIGTPGLPNETCFEYAVVPISGAFEDISADGTEVLSTVSATTGYGVATLPAPFRYFDTVFNEINLSMDGVATFGPPLTASLTTNAVKPTIAAPNGSLAVFWDDLVKLPTGKLLIARKPAYTVVSWQNFRFSFPSGGDLSFQLKLFDSGVIEFHYGTMTPTPTALTRSTGLSATTWIEQLNGEAALPININVADVIFPNTGYRFVPQP